jgi:TonB family protein
VRTLNDALAAERSQDNRAQYQEKLRELGGTIAGLQAQLVAAPQPEAASAAPPAADGPAPAAAAAPTAVDSRGVAAPPPPSSSPSPAPERATEIRAPALVSPLQLAYPRVARQLRREATVELLLTVEADGAVSAAEPVGPRVGLGFEEAAQQAALRARFSPGTRDGVAQRMQTRLSVRFELSSR